MTVKRGSLGRNLSALLSQSSLQASIAKSDMDNRQLALDCLQPGKYQPRTDIEASALDELAASIKQQGLLQPLIVRELSPNRFEIIAGERRWRACQLAGLSEVPVIVRQVDDETAMAIALIENLQRENLNAMDQARAIHRLTDEFDLTHQQVADLLSKSRTAVSNFLRLLTLADEVKRLLEHGDLDMGHARALLMLNAEQQIQAARLVVAKNLSVRETENLVKRIKQEPAKPLAQTNLPSPMHSQVQQLAAQFNTKINLKESKPGKGSLVIHYNSSTQLEALLVKMLD